MQMPIDLILVRHGESEGNVAHRLSEAGDHSAFTEEFKARHSRHYRLTDLGRRQVAAAGEWLKKNGFGRFDAYFTSEYIRAKETAALLGFKKAAWYFDVNLRERDWGDMDNASELEKQTVFAEAIRRKERDRMLWYPPNGESMMQVRQRFYDHVTMLRREFSDSQVVLACHGEVMWVARMMLEKLPLSVFEDLSDSQHPHDKIQNCQIFHYTRRNPVTRELSRHADWMRSVCPWDTSLSSNVWKKIIRRKFSNRELLKEVMSVPRLINTP
jgi:broad specificity phosphatase PhoE